MISSLGVLTAGLELRLAIYQELGLDVSNINKLLENIESKASEEDMKHKNEILDNIPIGCLLKYVQIARKTHEDCRRIAWLLDFLTDEERFSDSLITDEGKVVGAVFPSPLRYRR